ncbi:hypothetical protein [Methylobacterium sp. Leaf112]|jgi:hypothetical protein|uniref:hypothetical protein n=1 Tax=Methylobacterium sp. Leaf112 TaxID=1736258 RepID=UPI0006FFE644|nr:hypothetical protein [Methylobacterium sp. Leaf112]KQP72247.1 hypothetical protein ASF52_01585 [Methylobacterium sp. Leaf112]
MRRGNAAAAKALIPMSSLDEAHDRQRPHTASPGARARAKPRGGKPAGWGRLGLAALLGLVAGTVLFPTAAKGRERVPPAR